MDQLIDFYTSRARRFAKRRKIDAHQDLMELALSDACIRALESESSEQEVDEEVKLRRLYSESISDLSRKWNAGKRPQQSNRINSVYDDNGSAIDPLELLSYNYQSDSTIALSIQKKLDESSMALLRLYLDGYTYREIGDKIGVSHVVVMRRLKRVAYEIREDLQDLVDAIQRQQELHPRFW